MNKKLKTSQKRCASCGANLTFDPLKQTLKCPHCLTTKNIVIDKNFQKHDVMTQASVDLGQSQNKVIKCESCGATADLNRLEFATRCPYCSSALIVEMEDLPGVRPDAIIPFQFDKSVAAKKFAEGVKKKWFVPNKFKKELPQSEITGVYIPAFLFDADCYSSYFGRLSTTEMRTIHGKTQTITKSFNIQGNNTLIHRNLEIEASSQLTQQELEDIKPFNYGGIKDYNSDFLRGYFVEHNDQSIQHSHTQARVLMKQAIRDDILRRYTYTSVDSLNINTDYRNEKYTYTILPTYRFSYQYGKKTYKTYMNGQTGQVGGNIPRSKWKIAFFTAFIILIIVGIVFLAMIASYK